MNRHCFSRIFKDRRRKKRLFHRHHFFYLFICITKNYSFIRAARREARTTTNMMRHHGIDAAESMWEHMAMCMKCHRGWRRSSDNENSGLTFEFERTCIISNALQKQMCSASAALMNRCLAPHQTIRTQDSVPGYTGKSS